MIGNFARMLRTNERVAEVAAADDGSGFDVIARTTDGAATVTRTTEGPPAAFAEAVEEDGGTVYVIPFMESFLGWLKDRKKDEPRGES